VAKPSDVLKIGQEVEAVVIGIQKDEQKIALGLRQLEDNPWEKIAQKYPMGTKVRGPVQSLTNYGAFVELEPGVHGMVHISDVSWTRKLRNLEDIFKIGDEVEAVVLSSDSDGHRIALGIKQLQENPWEKIDEYFKVGDVVKGKVVKLTNFGAFMELNHNVDGFIHIGQISEERINKVRDVLKVGEEVSAVVIKIEAANQRIALSIKALDYDESTLQRELNTWKNSSHGEFGTIGDLFEKSDSSSF
jgi:small subunit ribosomal protein S1